MTTFQCYVRDLEENVLTCKQISFFYLFWVLGIDQDLIITGWKYLIG